VSRGSDTGSDARRIETLYREKAAAEIAMAEKLVPGAALVRGQGDALADVLLVKGEPGSGDLKKRRALAGDDGAAIGKALDALGLAPARYAVCTRIGTAKSKRLARLRLLAEAIDPRTVVLLDREASEDFAAAFGVEMPVPGQLVRVLGRDVVAVDGFEAALADEARKRLVWAQLRALEQHDEG
jgi:hypothetical protein